MGRTKQPRQRNKVIIIVPEGEETERNYFENYRQVKRNVAITIKIPRPKGTDPVSLVNYAQKFISQEDIDLNPEAGDRVWCVFDVDNNSEEKIQQAKKLADHNGYEVILSNPSFELWFLLHFKYTTRSMSNRQLLLELEKFIPGYEKSKDIFYSLLSNQSIAINNARKLIEQHRKDGIGVLSTKSNPCTMVYTMVEYLNNCQ